MFFFQPLFFFCLENLYISAYPPQNFSQEHQLPKPSFIVFQPFIFQGVSPPLDGEFTGSLQSVDQPGSPGRLEDDPDFEGDSSGKAGYIS